MRDYMKSFEELKINEKTLTALKEKGFENPTDVQESAIPPAMDGKDLVVQARTGSGKTHAFLIPVFDRISDKKEVQALVLTPTRELAQQVEQEARDIGKKYGIRTLAVYGGASIGRQIEQLPKVSMVVGTPGRIMDLMRRGHLDLGAIKFFILDEGDRMMDMGFLPDIKWIMRRTPEKKQIMLFSATMPYEIVRLAKNYMDEPVVLKLSKDEISAKGVSQHFVKVGRRNKLSNLSALLDNEPGKYLIFLNTKRGVQWLADRLKNLGYKAFPMHGDMNQSSRTKTINRFKNGDIDILISTDVSARGIDVENITHVVNYDIPKYEKDYVHRIGRTGRLDKGGRAITFVSKNEIEFLDRIEEYIEREVEGMEVKGKGRLKRRVDYSEHSDIFGMVTFSFEIKEDMSMWEVVKKMNKNGFRGHEVGEVKMEGNKGTLSVVSSKANRVPKVGFLKNVKLVKQELR